MKKQPKKLELLKAELKSDIALLSLETEVKRQRLQWQETPNELLTQEQQDIKYLGLNFYMNAAVEEKGEIRVYNENFQDNYYEKRIKELSEETARGFKKLKERYPLSC